MAYPGCFKNGTPSEPSGDQPKFPSFDERDGHKPNRLESSLSVDRLESQEANATDRADPTSPSVDHLKSQAAYTGCFEEVLSLGNDPDDATKKFCCELARVPLAVVSDKSYCVQGWKGRFDSIFHGATCRPPDCIIED